MKYLLLALPILFAGCSTVQLVEPAEISTQIVEKTIDLIPENNIEAVAAMPVIEEKRESVTATPVIVETKPEPTVIDKVKTIVATVKKVKKTVDEVKDVWDNTAESNNLPSAPTVPEKQMPAMAPPPDYKTGTGAKVSLFGVGMEFWLGNNDSWSTVLKLLVLLLVTYGGFKSINYFFDKKTNLKTIQV